MDSERVEGANVLPTPDHSAAQHCWTAKRTAVLAIVIACLVLSAIGVLIVVMFSSANNPAGSVPLTETPEANHQITMGLFQGVFESFRTGGLHLPFPTEQSAHGEALYSWRVGVTSTYANWGEEDAYDEAKRWDDPANRILVYRSSGFASREACEKAKEKYKLGATGRELFPDTCVMAITGPETVFGDGERPPMSMEFDDIPRDAILLVESRASGVPWPAPGDFDIRTMPQTINAPDGSGISGQYVGGFTVLFADGSAWFLSDKVPFETLKQFFTVAEARKHDREKLLAPYALDRMPPPLPWPDGRYGDKTAK